MTVVHLHALPLDERMWPGVEAPRLYGLGRTMDEWADAVLEAYPGQLILVGASMGGYCAVAAARRAPERLAGLVLAGSRPDPDSPERHARGPRRSRSRGSGAPKASGARCARRSSRTARIRHCWSGSRGSRSTAPRTSS